MPLCRCSMWQKPSCNSYTARRTVQLGALFNALCFVQHSVGRWWCIVVLGCAELSLSYRRHLSPFPFGLGSARNWPRSTRRTVPTTGARTKMSPSICMYYIPTVHNKISLILTKRVFFGNLSPEIGCVAGQKASGKGSHVSFSHEQCVPHKTFSVLVHGMVNFLYVDEIMHF